MYGPLKELQITDFGLTIIIYSIKNGMPIFLAVKEFFFRGCTRRIKRKKMLSYCFVFDKSIRNYIFFTIVEIIVALIVCRFKVISQVQGQIKLEPRQDWSKFSTNIPIIFIWLSPGQCTTLFDESQRRPIFNKLKDDLYFFLFGPLYFDTFDHGSKVLQWKRWPSPPSTISA